MSVRQTLTTREQCSDAASKWLDHNTELDCEAQYHLWEQAFITRWGLIPEDSGIQALQMVDQMGRGPVVTFPQAARAWHMNSFRVSPEQIPAWRRMEREFDLVPQEQVEGELTPEDWEKVEQYNEQHNPNHPSRRGRLFR